MSPDSIDIFTVDLSDFLNEMLNTDKFDYDEFFVPLSDFVSNNLDKFCTKDRNYN